MSSSSALMADLIMVKFKLRCSPSHVVPSARASILSQCTHAAITDEWNWLDSSSTCTSSATTSLGRLTGRQESRQDPGWVVHGEEIHQEAEKN